MAANIFKLEVELHNASEFLRVQIVRISKNQFILRHNIKVGIQLKFLTPWI